VQNPALAFTDADSENGGAGAEEYAVDVRFTDSEVFHLTIPHLDRRPTQA